MPASKKKRTWIGKDNVDEFKGKKMQVRAIGLPTEDHEKVNLQLSDTLYVSVWSDSKVYAKFTSLCQKVLDSNAAFFIEIVEQRPYFKVSGINDYTGHWEQVSGYELYIWHEEEADSSEEAELEEDAFFLPVNPPNTGKSKKSPKS